MLYLSICECLTFTVKVLSRQDFQRRVYLYEGTHVLNLWYVLLIGKVK